MPSELWAGLDQTSRFQVHCPQEGTVLRLVAGSETGQPRTLCEQEAGRRAGPVSCLVPRLEDKQPVIWKADLVWA